MIQTAVVCDKEGCQARAVWDTTKLSPQNAANHWLLRSAVGNVGWTSKTESGFVGTKDFCPEHSG